jgi:3,5-epimerase/4-reductase
VGEILAKQGADFEYGTARLEDRAGVVADIERVRLRCRAAPRLR